MKADPNVPEGRRFEMVTNFQAGEEVTTESVRWRRFAEIGRLAGCAGAA